MEYARAAVRCFRRAAWRVDRAVALPCLWGLFLLFITVLLWVATALLLQELLLNAFPKPLFATLVQSACPVLFLLPPAVAALRSSSAWALGSREKGFKVPIWQVALAGFLAKDAQVLTVDKCLRLMQQQHQQTVTRPTPAEQTRGGWLLGALLSRARGGGKSTRIGAPLCCCCGTTEGAAVAQGQSSPEALEKALPHPAAGCCSRCSTPESTNEGERAAPHSSSLSVSPATSPAFSISSLPSVAPPAAVSRRACAAEGPAGSTSSSSSTTGCSSRSSDGEGQGAAVGRSCEGWQVGGGWEEGVSEGTEALAAKEMKIRMRSVKRSLPLTAVWLIAQLSFDASLPLLSITSNSVIQSTSVFFCYFLAVVFLKQPPRRSVLTWLIVLAGGVGLISSHVPTVYEAPAPPPSAHTPPAPAAFPVASMQQQGLPAIPLISSNTTEAGPPASAVATQSDGSAGTEPPMPLAVKPAKEPVRLLAGSVAGRTAGKEGPQGPSAPPAGTAKGLLPENIMPASSVPAAAAAAAAATPAVSEWGETLQGRKGRVVAEVNDTMLGYFLCFLAATAYAVHTTALKAQEIRDPDFDVGLVYGLMGLWVLVTLPVLTLVIHVCRIESFMWPNLLSWAVLLLCGIVGTALADFCWGRAVFLLNPVVASAASNVQIPISLLVDALLLGRSFDGWYVAGMVAVVAAVVAVTLITADKPQHKKRRLYSPVTDMRTCEAIDV